MGAYASGTEVSAERSRAEIEKTLARYGASEFAYASNSGRAMIGFALAERKIRFLLPMPDPNQKEFTHSHGGRHERHPEAAYRHWEQATRQRWRALSLAVKAKLEAVQSGIATIDDEFMSYIVLPGGKTVGEEAKPMIDHMYKSGKAFPLLDFKR